MRIPTTRSGRWGTALAVILCFLASTTEASNMSQPMRTELLHTIYFKNGGSKITSGEQKRLNSILVSLRATDRKILVLGYTDNIGNKEYNDKLAMKRAGQAAYYLVKRGISKDRFEARGSGLQGYVTDNSNEAMRRYNRRVEIRLYESGLHTGDLLRSGRYLENRPGPDPDQANPVADMIEVSIPYSVQSIGGALSRILNNSGWSLAEPHAADPSFERLLSLDLPETQRQLGPMRMFEAVAVLCGDAYVVVMDPVNRLISCELRREYRDAGWQQAPVPESQASESGAQTTALKE